MAKWAALALGGILGVFGRYFLSASVYSWSGTGFPYGTLVVNVSGCFAIGVLDSWAGARGLLGPTGRLLLMTGFCGAFTTFSTLILESANLANDGELLRALANYLGSGVLGLLLFKVGVWLGTVV
ncbi:MAG: fluoride efflux transporter CrcB [Elusimicrobia bacterium]|nr:fluoride efflux transporter CrcB [Elusimicrobiota bacterium]MDE2427056.1 fluoride efflux transporter CrcB [Elusimicrobiota bacterium]